MEKKGTRVFFSNLHGTEMLGREKSSDIGHSETGSTGSSSVHVYTYVVFTDFQEFKRF